MPGGPAGFVRCVRATGDHRRAVKRQGQPLVVRDGIATAALEGPVAVARKSIPGHHDRMIELGARSHPRRAGPAGRVRLATLAARAALASLVALVAATAAIGAAPPGAAGSGSRPQSGSTAQSLSAWTGGINLYRDGVFTTQASWLYCTAADVQIMKNMIEGTEDHSSAAQTIYFDWMRTQNRYDLPLSAGVDPAG